jgi:hypothetical protein
MTGESIVTVDVPGCMAQRGGHTESRSRFNLDEKLTASRAYGAVACALLSLAHWFFD